MTPEEMSERLWPGKPASTARSNRRRSTEGPPTRDSIQDSQFLILNSQLSPARTSRLSAGWLAFAGLLLLVCAACHPAFGAGTVAACSEQALLAALQGGGDVVFTQDCGITLTAPIGIDLDTTIDAGTNTVTVTGNNNIRLFNVSSGVRFTLSNLTITGGLAANGGAIHISQNATVLLTNCTVAGNAAVGDNGLAGATGGNSSYGNGGDGQNGASGTPGLGGAIYNLGGLTLLKCMFATNSATGGSGGSGGNGGNGLLNAGNGGSGGSGGLGAGGAVWNGGSLTAMDCTFSNNFVIGGDGAAGGNSGTGAFAGLTGIGGAGATGAGGALFSGKQAVVSDCTFDSNSGSGGNSAVGGTEPSGNGSTGQTGGVALGGAIAFSDSAAITNCTFYNDWVQGGTGGKGGNGSMNAGDGGNGGDSYGGGAYANGQIAIINSTFSSCGAADSTNGVAGAGTFPASDGNRGAGHGGAMANGGGGLVLINSILNASWSGGNLYGPLINSGYNISSDATGSLGGHSRQDANPKLGALADNGGPTQTMLPLAGSPAIDAGENAAAPHSDQRHLPRPAPGNSHPDLGAAEVQPASPPSLDIALPAAPALTNVLGLTFLSQIGSKYVLQFKPTLEDTNWAFLSTNTGTGGPLTNQASLTNSSGFYRLWIR